MICCGAEVGRLGTSFMWGADRSVNLFWPARRCHSAPVHTMQNATTFWNKYHLCECSKLLHLYCAWPMVNECLIYCNFSELLAVVASLVSSILIHISPPNNQAMSHHSNEAINNTRCDSIGQIYPSNVVSRILRTTSYIKPKSVTGLQQIPAVFGVLEGCTRPQSPPATFALSCASSTSDVCGDIWEIDLCCFHG